MAQQKNDTSGRKANDVTINDEGRDSWLKNIKSFLAETGKIARFTGRFFTEAIKPRYEFRELLRQCYYIGYKSLPLVLITAFIMGLVITIQARPTLVEFGAQAWLPKMVSVSLVR